MCKITNWKFSSTFPFWQRFSSFEDERGLESIEASIANTNSSTEMMPLLRQANQCTVGPSYGATRTRRKPLQNFVEHKVTIQFSDFSKLQYFHFPFRFLPKIHWLKSPLNTTQVSRTSNWLMDFSVIVIYSSVQPSKSRLISQVHRLKLLFPKNLHQNPAANFLLSTQVILKITFRPLMPTWSKWKKRLEKR